MSFILPKNTCNAHLHIIDPAYPNDGKAESHRGTIEEYQKVAAELGLDRAVFVQAKDFATDNSCLIDALDKFGKDNARGIAVVKPDIAESELAMMHEHGVRGLRFSLWNPNNAVVTVDGVKPLSERIKHYGWNIQMHASARQLMEWSDLLENLDCKIVIDHMGRLDPKLGVDDPAFKFICKLIDKGNTWVKVSGPYLNTTTGYPWYDSIPTGRAYVKYAPERMLWGSDWPHVTELVKPAEKDFVNLIEAWFETARERQLALVENPCEVYGFKL